MKSAASPILLAALMCVVAPASAGVVLTNSGFASATTTLTFDELNPDPASQTSLTTQFAAYGVTFAGAVYNPLGGPSTIGTAITGNYIGNSPAGSPSFGTNPWSILFTPDIGSAAFGIVTPQGSTSLVEALLDDVVVDSLLTTPSSDGTNFFQITGFTFDAIRLTLTAAPNSGLPDIGFIDNLQFSPPSAAVPEPATLALVSMALLGLARVARRKQ